VCIVIPYGVCCDKVTNIYIYILYIIIRVRIGWYLPQPRISKTLFSNPFFSVPRRSTASSLDDRGLGGLQRLEIWTGKSQTPERFGILLRLWSLLLRRQGLARACNMFSRVLFSFLSPFPLNCLRVCGLSLPLSLSPSLSHHLSLHPSMRVSVGGETGTIQVGFWGLGFRV